MIMVASQETAEPLDRMKKRATLLRLGLGALMVGGRRRKTAVFP